MKEQHIKEHPLMNEGAGGADMRSTFLWVLPVETQVPGERILPRKIRKQIYHMIKKRR